MGYRFHHDVLQSRSPARSGVESLDNFYAKQHKSGEICREIARATGRDLTEWTNTENQPLFSRIGWSGTWDDRPEHPRPIEYRGREAPSVNPSLTLDGLNHPILAWAEMESFRQTGDRERLDRVLEPLTRYFGALDTYLRQGNGLYMTDWASMDNSPRNPFLSGGGTGVDTSAEMALFARNLAEIARETGRDDMVATFEEKAEIISDRINELMWNEAEGFYFDLTADGKRTPIKTIAGFWPLVAGVASKAQAARLVESLLNPDTFGRTCGIPSLAADEEDYDPSGGYWRGAVWAPTTTMVIRGLERYGYHDLASTLATRHLETIATVFLDTGTIWENYAADNPVPGRPARPDFVGWSGMGPIRYLLEYAIGLKADAPANTLTWILKPGFEQGCERYRFGGHVTSLVASPDGPGSFNLDVESDGPYVLNVAVLDETRRLNIRAGNQKIALQHAV